MELLDPIPLAESDTVAEYQQLKGRIRDLIMGELKQDDPLYRELPARPETSSGPESGVDPEAVVGPESIVSAVLWPRLVKLDIQLTKLELTPMTEPDGLIREIEAVLGLLRLERRRELRPEVSHGVDLLFQRLMEFRRFLADGRLSHPLRLTNRNLAEREIQRGQMIREIQDVLEGLLGESRPESRREVEDPLDRLPRDTPLDRLPRDT